ncbi:hypothetical protein BaRGS_00001095 [Batillaria attramentaria]|uniref:Methyltransferase-like protein 23 n=1 Tax=Batillaria attramentaria TaxID=370345 RepID=A0ABD0M5Y6_9CAEN
MQTTVDSSSNKEFVSTKVFTFHSWTQSESRTLTVVIPEVANAAYGMYTWPCAPVLAQYVWHNEHLLRGKTVLEIGSGTALTGVVAAKCGARVILSDSALYPDCLENCQKSCKANNLTGVDVIPLTWGIVSPPLLQLPPVHIILGSDCFYDTKDFEDVLVTVAFLMNRNVVCEFWCTYQKRSATRSIEFYLSKWSLQAKEIPVSSFCDEDFSLRMDCPGIDSVHLFIITSKKTDRPQDVSAVT